MRSDAYCKIISRFSILLGLGTQILYAFRQLLKKLKITQSFSNAGTPHDNAVMESFFSVFKKEEFYRSTYRSEAEMRKKIDEYITFYNQKRPHTTLNYQTPEQYEDAFFEKRKSPFSGVRGSDF